MLRYEKYVELNTVPEFTGEPTEYGTGVFFHTFVPSISTYPTPNVEQIYNNNNNNNNNNQNNNNNEIIFIGVFSTISAFVIIVLIFFYKKNCPNKKKKTDTIEYEFGTQWTHDNV